MASLDMPTGHHHQKEAPKLPVLSNMQIQNKLEKKQHIARTQEANRVANEILIGIKTNLEKLFIFEEDDNTLLNLDLEEQLRQQKFIQLGDKKSVRNSKINQNMTQT